VLSKTPMQIVVRQISGLGNQMFQYAAGRYYADRYGAQMSMVTDPERNAFSHGYPRPFLLSKFSITAPFRELSRTDRLVLSGNPRLRPTAAILGRILGAQMLREEESQRYRFLRDLSIQRGTRIGYLVGYWQVYPLVEAVAAQIRSEFRLREPAEGKNLEVLNRISSSSSPVSIHIRRGDYTLAAEGNYALPIDYYLRAIRVARERLSEPTFFVFSDDIDFARQNLPNEIQAVFVDHNDSFHAHEDLRLMSSCHHHIIANSTLSWWGAWLGARLDKMVLAPKNWRHGHLDRYPDLLPPEWILIDDSETSSISAP
jgi:Glycosyl transferase family 11